MVGPSFPPGSSQGSGDLWAADFAPDLVRWPDKANRAREMWRTAGIEPGGHDRRALRILDVACGAGIDTLSLVRDTPSARLVGLDLHPEVLQITRLFARRMGMEERVELRSADILTDDVGQSAYGVAFCGSVLYFFDRPRVTAIFRRIHAALEEGGLLVLRHRMPDEKGPVRTGPAMLAVQLLLFHPGSCVYTASE